MNETILKSFQNKKIRTVFDKEKWYFSIVDIIEVLIGSERPRKYWNDLKVKLHEEGSQLSEKIGQLKLLSSDGKYYKTDCLDLEGIFRLIQSIPSKKVEPLKLWLAKIGRERIDEIYDPEIAIDRVIETYRNKGYSENWISQRIKSIDIRKEFTDELRRSGINSNKDFAILTDILTQTWSGFSVKEYKDKKGLTKENLRDNMNNLELVLNELAEVSSTEISKILNPSDFNGVKKIVIKGGTIARNAKEQIENEKKHKK